MQGYKNCKLCPRNCEVDRAAGKKGYCGETAELRVAGASIHQGEEPPITGTGGSGTIFITGCNLGCSFCQNYQISQKGIGIVVREDDFARMCLALQEGGAENINIVTGSHAIPAIVTGVSRAQTQGLAIPVLWNSSAYESLESLSLLEDTIDVYLPDLKTLDSRIGDRFFNAPDYPDYAQAAIKRMMEARQLRFKPIHGTEQESRVLVSGVIIRHLVLPGYLKDTKEVIRWFAEHGRNRALLSIMMQYTPIGVAAFKTEPKATQGRLDRYVDKEEYDQVLQWIEEFAITEGFYQELTSNNTWLPDFNRQNPFPSGLSTPVWHWKGGFLW